MFLEQIWVNLIKSWGHLKDVSATGCCLQIEQQPNLKFNNDFSNPCCLYLSTTFRWWKSFDCTFWPQPWWQRACQACLLILSWDFWNQSENIRRLLHGTNYHLEEMCSRSQKGNWDLFTGWLHQYVWHPLYQRSGEYNFHLNSIRVMFGMHVIRS